MSPTVAEIVQNVRLLPEVFSPKDLARVAKVSESSVKRWCDKGLIAAERTGGGHRRLRAADVLAFLRNAVKEPELDLLGVGGRGSERQTDEEVVEALTLALTDGSDEAARHWTTRLFLSNWSVAKICDNAIAEVFRRIGDRWECRSVEVFQERRACGITLRLIEELKAMTARPDPAAPLAIGAAPEGDPYSLPTAMCEAVMHESGWRAQSLGSGIPFASLAAAVEQMRPKLFWLSVSAIEDEPSFLAGWHGFVERCGPDLVTVIGGRALNEELRRRMPFTIHCDDLQHLQSFAKLCRPSIAA